MVMGRLLSLNGRVRKLLNFQVVKFSTGVSLIVDNEAISPFLKGRLYGELYERAESEIIKNTLSAHDRVLELGASIGYIANVSRNILSSGNCYLGVEANPKLISLFDENAKLNGHGDLVCLNGAAGSQEGECSFFLSEHFWASSLTSQPGSQEVTVKVFSFDKLIKDHSPNYLIIDIEGGEYDLLYNRDLVWLQKLCLEFHPDIYGKDKSEKLMQWILGQGFSKSAEYGDNRCFYFERQIK